MEGSHKRYKNTTIRKKNNSLNVSVTLFHFEPSPFSPRLPICLMEWR